MESSRKQDTWLSTFFRDHPIAGFVGFFGGLASIAGIIVLLFTTKEKRELVFQCNPVRTRIVQASRPSSIEVLHRGQKIEQDISAVQIAIWNKGKREILDEDILKDIVLMSEPTVRILDAEITKNTRPEIIDMTINKDHFLEGKIPIAWKILEHDDGIVLQLIYEGAENIELTMLGSLIGQRNIEELKTPYKLKSPNQQIRESSRGWISILIIGFGLLAMSIWMLTYNWKHKNKMQKRLASYTDPREAEEFKKNYMRFYKKMAIFPLVLFFIAILIIIYSILGQPVRPPLDF